MREIRVVVRTNPTRTGWLIWPFMFWSAEGEEAVGCRLLKQESWAASYAVWLGNKVSGTLLPENEKVSSKGKVTGRMYKTKIPISISVSFARSKGMHVGPFTTLQHASQFACLSA